MSKAAHQNGKPVIEERVLSQILYSLPQLFELNQDLLKELRLRLATWYDNIFNVGFDVVELTEKESKFPWTSYLFVCNFLINQPKHSL